MAKKESYAPEITLDRSSPIPLYHQIAAPLEQEILSGRLQPGTRIEEETAMAKRLNVSRPTARRALQNLVDHGLLIRQRGVGTQVTPTRIHRPAELTSLHEDLVASGKKPHTEVLSYEVIPASEFIADKLEIEVGELVVAVKRLRYANGVPLAIMGNFLPANLAPAVTDLQTQGLYQTLREKGAVTHVAKQTVSARRASPKESKLLNERAGSALLTMERIAYDAAGHVIEYGNHVYRAEVYSLQLTLFAS